VSTAVYTRNVSQVCKNGDPSLTPYARWFGITGSTPITHLRVFGCDADVLFTKAPGHKLSKLTHKSRRCMFVGYDDKKNHAWRFYDPHTLTVFSSRDATFHEDQFTVSHQLRESAAASADGDEHDTDEEWLTRTTFDNETKLIQIISKEEEEEKNLSIDPPTPSKSSSDSDDSSTSDGGESEIDSDAEESNSFSSLDPRSPSPAVRVAGVRQPRVINRPPPRESHHRAARDHRVQRYGMENGNLAQGRFAFIGFTDSDTTDPTTSIVLNSLPPSMQLPRNATEAMAHPEWRAAREKELAAHAKNGTWIFTPLHQAQRHSATKRCTRSS